MNFFNKIFKIKSKKEFVTLPFSKHTPMIGECRQCFEIPVEVKNDFMRGVLHRARKITEETGMAIDGWTTTKVRRWHKDPNGDTIAQNGERGYYGEFEINDISPNLITNGGRDDFIDKCYIHNGAGSAAGNYIALSNDAGAPSVTDTVLASEIVANGLSRAQATTRTHTTGNNDWSLQYTWTCTTAPQSAQKAGLFNASSVGTLSHENTFTSVSLQVNDQLQLTWSGTLG